MTVFPVAIAAKLNVPVHVIDRLVETKVILPYMFNVPVPANVITPSNTPPAPPNVKSKQLAETLTVTVNAVVPEFELPSNITMSADVGTVAPAVAALIL